MTERKQDEKRSSLERWIYRYIRADLEEIDQGPWATQEEAQDHANKHASYGAPVTTAIKVDADYELYQPED